MSNHSARIKGFKLSLKIGQIRKMAIGILWYVAPLTFLSFYIERHLPIATLATISLILGWIFGSLLSTNLVLVDNFKFKPVNLLRFGFFVIFSTFILQIIALNNLKSQVYLDLYRDSVFEDPTFLFGSTILYTLYNSFLLPAILVGIPLVAFLRKKKSTNFAIYAFFALLLIDAIIKFARFPIIHVLFFVLYFYRRLGFDGFKLLMSILIFAPLMLIILWLRQYSEFADISDIMASPEILFKSFISYNLIGFFILNDTIESSNVDINPLNFNMLSAYFYYFEVFIGRLGLEIWYPWKTLVLELTNARYIADLDIIGNAFGTNLLPAYFDLGVFGPFFLGLYLGFLSIISTKGPLSVMVSCISMFIMIFGIYQSVVVSPVAIAISLPILLTLVRFKIK